MAADSRRKLMFQQKVEVRSLEEGFLGSWHTATVVGCRKLTRLVRYDHLLDDKSLSSLTEQIKVSHVIDGFVNGENDVSCDFRGVIRPLPPSCVVKEWPLHYGQCVDLLYNDAWWEGVIFDHDDGCEKRKVFFPDMGDEMKASIDSIRISQDWDEVREEWIPRKYWLFLVLVEEFEKECPLPISVKQIWYDIRMKEGFEKLKEWTCSKECVWRELIWEVLTDNFRIMAEHLFPELHFSLVEFREPDFDDVFKLESFYEVYKKCQEDNTERALSMVPLEPKTSTRRCRLIWQSAVPDLIPGPAFCPNAIDEYKKEFELTRRCSSTVMSNVRKHLLHLGWKVEFANDNGLIRRRYSSPDGEPFYSLPEVFRRLNSESISRSEIVMIPSCRPEETLSPPLAVNSQSPDPLENDYVVIEPEYCPEAVTEYCLIRGHNKDLRGLHEQKVLRARKHLSAIGWSFYYHMKGRKRELRYISPTGKTFHSLIIACEWCVESGMLTSVNKPHLPLVALESPETVPLLSDKVEDISMSNGVVQSRGCKVYKSRKRRKHDNEGSASPKRRRTTRSSTRARKDTADPNSSTSVRRSSKRVREMVASSSQQRPQTILSWLIDNNVVSPREKVKYCGGNKVTIAEGKISRDGIKCSCCGEVFTLSNFEVHAGGINHRPSSHIFLGDGRSLLECQMQLKREKSKQSLRSESREMKGRRSNRTNDNICSACHYGGELLLCDLCPSAFHIQCLGLKEVPDGDWFCPSCCCQLCGQAGNDKENRQGVDPSVLTCSQCEHRYHAECIKNPDAIDLDSYSEGPWFCQDTCEQIFYGLREMLGVPNPVGTDNLTWTLIKYTDHDACDDDESLTESYSKLNVALSVMHECFEPVKEPRTRRDLVEDVMFNRRSDLHRLNFQGFYTVLLEKNEELISTATVRIYGKKVAEVPLVATRFKYRRLGMCRILMNALEKKLMELGVERLVLPAVPSVLHTWTNSFGFSVISESERLNFLSFTFLNFQGTVGCQKLLTNPLELTLYTGTQANVNTELDQNDEQLEVNLQGVQVEETETETAVVEQRSTCTALGTDNENASCSAQLAIVAEESCLPNPLPFKTRIMLDCAVTPNDEKQNGEGNNGGILKCYKRRRISAC